MAVQRIPPPGGARQATVVEKARPAWVDVAPIGVVAITTVVLLVLARSNDAGASPEISVHAVAAVVLGGLVNSLLLSVFRSGEIKRFSNPYYTIPPWRPSLVASLLVLVGWVAALVASYWIGLSWSRR